MPQRQRPDPPLPPIVSRAEARSAGLSDGEIRVRVRSHRWQVLAPGLYLRADVAADNPYELAEARHGLESMAAARRYSGSTVAFGSAALLHQMPLASGLPRYHELVVTRGHWNGVRGSTRVRLAELDDEDVWLTAGVPVTSPARTWVDIARGGDLADTLSTGDFALRRGLVTADDLSRAIDRHTAQRALSRARTALPLLDPLRETPLESRSFAQFIGWDLPLPECQVDVYDDDGFIGRVDFLWRLARLIGEADGRLKYSHPSAIYAEKRREDRLRAAGYTVVRWGWDLDPGLRARLTRELSSSSSPNRH